LPVRELWATSLHYFSWTYY